MPDVLIYGDTLRSPELRHEVPLGIGDPFLYVEKDGVSHIQIGSMEIPRLAELGRFELHPSEEFGVARAVVPQTFPLWLGDHLRANGIELTVDRDFFDDRRRVKTADEIEGIRRAQAAAEAGMTAARELLRRASTNGGRTLEVDGRPLTVERVKSAVAQAFIEHGCSSSEMIVSHGAQAAVGHDSGSGEIRQGEPIVIDIWPRDDESGCYADMTRTFVLGEPPDELVEWHRLVLEALELGVAASRPGARGREVYDATCDVFERAGHPTQRTKEPGTVLEEGFFHGLGHGVGLEVHEAPAMGLISNDALVAGDVVTVEPGLYRPGFGGVRLEDLVLVTESGPENLTDFPYDLAP